MIRSHEGDAECMVPSGSEIDEPRRLKSDLEAEPADVEVAAFGALVGYDYRVQVLDLQVGSSSVAAPRNSMSLSSWGA